MHWHIIENKSSLSYITSDSPVCINNIEAIRNSNIQEKTASELFKWLMDYTGSIQWRFANEEDSSNIFLTFPLSSNLLLLMSDETKSFSKDVSVDSSENAARSFNRLTIFQAREFIFSDSKSFGNVSDIDFIRIVHKTLLNDITSLINHKLPD